MNEQDAGTSRTSQETKTARSDPPFAVANANPSAPDGPPTTVFGVVIRLAGVVTGYTALFKIADKSAFPEETLANPWYWLGIAILFLLAATWAFKVRNTSNWVDSAMVSALLLISIGAFVKWRLVARDEAPSDKTFTVAVFDFAGDAQPTKDVAGLFQGAVIRELEKLEKDVAFGGGFHVVPRGRPINSPTWDERVAEILKWSKRKEKGAHLGIWMNVGWDGSNYVLTSLYVKVYTFGKEKNDVLFDMNISPHKPYKSARSKGEHASLDPDQVGVVVKNIRFHWGIANYQRGDYAKALLLLRDVGTSASEYYAGLSAHQESYRLASQELAEEAKSRFESAISKHPEDDYVKAAFYEDLGQAHLLLSDWLTATEERAEVEKATHAFANSIEAYERAKLSTGAAGAKIGEAQAFYILYLLDEGDAEIQDLNRVQQLLAEAFPAFGKDDESDAYGRLLALQGTIDLRDAELESDSDAEADYRNAVENLEAARQIAAGADNGNLASRWRELGRARTRYAIFLATKQLVGGENMFDNGLNAFDRSAELCQQERICLDLHEQVGEAETDWSKALKPTSLMWGAALDRAVAEYRLAESFVSRERAPDKQVQVYARLKSELAEAHTQRALGDIQAGHKEQGVTSLRDSLSELDTAIDALKDVGSMAPKLYDERAECYRRLYDYSAVSDKDYLERARRDREKARKLRSP